MLVVRIHRDEGMIMPTGQTMVKKDDFVTNDRIHVSTKKTSLDRLLRRFVSKLHSLNL